MWVFDIVENHNVVQLDVQVLIHALKSSSYRNVILELDCDFVIDQGLEEAVQ